jgi:ribulose-bisphosphate carboxylase large chain
MLAGRAFIRRQPEVTMTLPPSIALPHLSHERFSVEYVLSGSAENARAIADKMTVEQTVEFPESALPAGDIPDVLVGRIETFESLSDRQQRVVISYAVETAGRDLPQLLNVLMGLSSLLPGIQARRLLAIPDTLLARYGGPRFGPAGLRERTGVTDRPLLCTAIKPMGLSAAQLADLAYRCARGGIDIVKDDHGIGNVVWSPFEERVARVAEAVRRANAETGRQALYAANVSGPHDQIVERALFAKRVGVGALMAAPASDGLDAIRVLASRDEIGLPVLSHPTLSGVFLAGGSSGSGFSPALYYGQLQRLAGADSVIFVSAGGRFPVDQGEIAALRDACRAPMGQLKPVMPMPGGGMTLPRVPEQLAFFGPESIFLMGGGLHTASPDLERNIEALLHAVGG